jgi:acyl-ACP thioesterase
MSEKVTLATWPQKAVRVRANRHYTISDSEGVAVLGKTEWAVINTASGKLQRLNDIYGEDFEFCEDISCEESYARISDNFDDAEVFAQYKICSNDIDIGQHMNNAAYIRALFSLFSTKELNDSNVKEIDITYKNQSYEGEILTIKVRKTDDGAFEYGMIKPDNTVAAVVRIVRE